MEREIRELFEAQSKVNMGAKSFNSQMIETVNDMGHKMLELQEQVMKIARQLEDVVETMLEDSLVEHRGQNGQGKKGDN